MVDNLKDKWIFNPTNPTQIGWYGVIYCENLDPRNGIHLHSHYWNGRGWEQTCVAPLALRSPIGFNTKEECDQWVLDHIHQSNSRE
jgi:hypothetical protein